MSTEDKLAGAWHLIALSAALLVVWEIGGVAGWWNFTRKHQYHECNCK